MKIRWYKFGLDAEFMLDRNGNMVSAEVLNVDRDTGTEQFVGTDGCPTTGEMRPPPAHNINLLLRYVADGICKLKAMQDRTTAFTSVLACPYVHSAPLGGHLHASGFLDPAGKRPNFRTDNLFRITADWLVAPLEILLQPDAQRKRRRELYAEDQDIRMQSITYVQPRSNEDYFHYEYRLPSTYLAHPRLAYAYLAAFKTGLLNWRTVGGLLSESWCDPDMRGTDMSITQEEARDQLRTRLKTMQYTRDCAYLPEAVRTMPMPIPTVVDYAAWERVLTK